MRALWAWWGCHLLLLDRMGYSQRVYTAAASPALNVVVRGHLFKPHVCKDLSYLCSYLQKTRPWSLLTRFGGHLMYFAILEFVSGEFLHQSDQAGRFSQGVWGANLQQRVQVAP